MRWYEKIIAAHAAVTDEFKHYELLKSSRYFCWQEYGGNDMLADNRHAETVIAGSTDLFTKQDFDPWFDEIQAAFDAHGIAWEYEATQYEEETKIIHHSWTWEVTDGKSDD